MVGLCSSDLIIFAGTIWSFFSFDIYKKIELSYCGWLGTEDDTETPGTLFNRETILVFETPGTKNLFAPLLLIAVLAKLESALELDGTKW